VKNIDVVELGKSPAILLFEERFMKTIEKLKNL